MPNDPLDAIEAALNEHGGILDAFRAEESFRTRLSAARAALASLRGGQQQQAKVRRALEMVVGTPQMRHHYACESEDGKVPEECNCWYKAARDALAGLQAGQQSESVDCPGIDWSDEPPPSLRTDASDPTTAPGPRTKEMLAEQAKLSPAPVPSPYVEPVPLVRVEPVQPTVRVRYVNAGEMKPMPYPLEPSAEEETLRARVAELEAALPAVVPAEPSDPLQAIVDYADDLLNNGHAPFDDGDVIKIVELTKQARQHIAELEAALREACDKCRDCWGNDFIWRQDGATIRPCPTCAPWRAALAKGAGG